jgi:uncharacterized protein YhaN
MRIDRLDLMAYGPFTDNTLDLSAGESGLHLIYGDNEAGKSTSLRALIAWLFGIPVRTKDSFLHSKGQLRIGGKLRLSDGNALEFVRRKANKGTLLKFGTDEPLDDAVLAPFLPGGIDESIYVRLWGIDHGRLIAGGQELLDQSGDLGQALFSAAVGTASSREVLAALLSSADEIFKPRAKKAILNQAIANFKAAQKKKKESSLPVSEWKKLHKELLDTNAAIALVETDIELKNKVKSRLDRHNRVKGALAERRTVLGRIEESGQVVLVPEDFENSRKAAHDSLNTVSQKKERAQAKLSNLSDESESLNVRHELLDNEEVILALYKGLGAVEKTLKDRPQQDAKRRLFRNDAEKLLKGVRPGLNLDQADDLRPLLNNKKWLSGLAQKYSLLTHKKEQAEATLKDIEDEQELLRSKFVEEPELELDLKELKATIAATRKAGDVELRLTDVQKRAAEEKASCDNELSRLGRFTGTVGALLKVAMPVSETLDVFEKENDQQSEELRDNIRKQHESEEDKKQTEQELTALLATGDVPIIADLEASRHDRNLGWSLIKRKYIQNVDIADDLSEFASDVELPTAYEQKVEAADSVSDRLRLAADQVVKRAGLEAKLEHFNARLDDLAKDLRKANESQLSHQKKWAAIWEPLGIDAGTPREMKQWLLKVEKLVTRVQSANAVAGDERNLILECERLKEAVSQQIKKLDTSIDLPGMSLETMLSLCEQRVEEAEGINERKRQLEQSLSDTEIRLKRTCEDLKYVATEQASWLEEWSQAIAGLGLTADVHPERATETFDQLISFFEKFDKSEELRKRIYGIDQVEEKFETQVFEFTDSIGFIRNGKEAATIAAQLHRDLNAAREARASLTKIEIQIKEIKEEIEDADITIRNSESQLAALREQAAVDTNDELVKAGELSRDRREVQKRLHALEQELNRHGDSLSIEELERESEESEVDSIEGELKKINLELTELQANRDGLRDQRQTLQNEINAKDGSAAAANASEEAEEHLATIVSNAEKYLRLQIAALILEQRIEDYRQKNQAPVLARAGELFSKLTLGSYARLRDELDDGGKPILLGVRPDDKEVPVDGMSDGSRDQLYLALRLATIEQHLSKGESMPFVVDDILIGFDDNRTRVCLEVLADLAASTQVLLFTHHRRVLDLAQNLDAKAGIFSHELS